MDEEDETKSKMESDEEDYESFFLQPASSPYNIAEKVQEANKLLFSSEENENSPKEQRVKFREALVDFEPDLTDDDVQSIESYNEVVDYSIAENPVEELKYVIQQDNEIYDIVEEAEEENEVIEEIVVAEEDDSIDEVKSISEEETEIVEKPVRPKSARKKSPPPTRRAQVNFHVECKSHCIEELESPLDMCISRLYLEEKPTCPPLKLHRRRCCENNKMEQKLPLYTGVRSEYGLSASQIERLQKRKEAIRRKEEKRLELQEEYRKRKIEQNELIYCQWLKEISSRKLQEGDKKCQSPVINGKRPKTAMGYNNNNNYTLQLKRRPRPHTTATCVFIEIPQRLLGAGIKIGDLYISNQDVSSKRIQVISFT